MSGESIRPSDIIGDNENYVELNGIKVRKGSVAAFIKNIEIYENSDSNESKENALKMIQELAPAIKASGLHDHVNFKNITIEKILNDLN